MAAWVFAVGAGCARREIPTSPNQSAYSDSLVNFALSAVGPSRSDSVRALFAAHGTVEKCSLFTDRDSGRPSGFGFVEMSTADASRAMQALNGVDSKAGRSE
jgi:RNA recognition motif-containing protein